MNSSELSIMPCYISRLPNRILRAIFFKLPITTIMKCRCVCKLWRDIIVLDPDFAHNFHCFRREPTSLFLCNDGRNHFWVELEGETCYFHQASNISKFEFPYFSNSCNGLFYIYPETRVSHVLNPITGEYINLPPHDRQRLLGITGLGFCPKSNQFKVVRVTCLWDHGKKLARTHEAKWQAQVYTLGSASSWRNIGAVPYMDDAVDWDSFDVLVNGSLHMRFDDRNRLDKILVFDFEREQFREFSLPPYHFAYVVDLGVFRDTLYFINDDCGVLEVWLMKEYGNDESWAQILVIEEQKNMFGNPRSFKGIKLLANGDVLFLCQEHMFLYNPRKKCYTKLNNDGIPSVTHATVYDPSFASLKDIVVGDCLDVLNVRSRH